MTAVATFPIVEALMAGVVDYAGLFPPAGLNMGPAVSNYDVYRSGTHHRLLGRFIVPVARLRELFAAASPLLPAPPVGAPWPLAVLIGSDAGADMQRLATIRETAPVGVVIDALEGKAATVAEITALAALTPPGVALYIEVPAGPNVASLLSAIARCGAYAKVRTGGVTADAIPSARDVASFLCAAARTPVAFKATAGLHHAVRGRYPLTYAPDSPLAVMHGFVNVIVAALMAHTGGTEVAVTAVLEETDREAFRFGADALGWRDQSFGVAPLRAARERFAHAFGSCSFREPVDELHQWHLL